MKITRVELFKADLPLKQPFRIAIGVTEVAMNVLVRIDTDEGLSGWGEASPFTPIVGETQSTCLDAGGDIAGLLLGKDPLAIEDRTREMARAMPHNTTIRSAFDIALYDLLGKAAGLPLYALLGGGRREVFTDNTVGIDRPEVMAEAAARFKERGFPAVKVKVGTTPAADIERIEKVRAAIGPELPIRIDANQGWDCVAAIQALRGMEGLGVQYCEQPVAIWDYTSMCKVHAKTKIPIMADESVFDEQDAFKLLSMDACDYLNIKLAKSGGIHTGLKINAVAEAAGAGCMVGCMSESRLALTAAAGLVSARPNIKFADLDSADMLKIDPIIGGMEYEKGGMLRLPDTPGIGADVDETFLERLESRVIE
jgi:L-alanine-DL-glutamate epimerase-like enolase superfamily enzyme